MPGGYCLMRHDYRDQKLGKRRLLALGSSATGRSCVDEINSRNDPNGILRMSVRSIDAIKRHGLSYATTHSLVRRLSKNVYLVEFKSNSTAWRMAAYLHEKQQPGQRIKTIPVLLEHFKGHGGKTGHIPEAKIQALEDKARIAKQLVEEEISDGNL